VKTTPWMTVVFAGLSLLPACGGEDLSTVETRRNSPVTENLAQTNHELALGGETYTLPVQGGTTGFPTQTECPGGYVAVGIHGRFGLHIDRLGLVCRVLNADNSLGATYYAGAQGGFGGDHFELWCPSGQAIAGFQGYSSDYIHQLKLHCSTPSVGFSPAPTESDSNPIGSYTGSSFSAMCPRSYLVTSLKVKVGSFVDQMQTVCTQLY
jgi:hypothetical protein